MNVLNIDVNLKKKIIVVLFLKLELPVIKNDKIVYILYNIVLNI